MAITPTAVAPGAEAPSSQRKKGSSSHLPMHMPANINLSGRISPISSMGSHSGQYRFVPACKLYRKSYQAFSLPYSKLLPICMQLTGSRNPRMCR